MISLDDVRLVAAIAEGASVRRAQVLLRGNHISTLYRRLRALEGRIGGPLFMSGSEGLVATSRAEPFLEAAAVLADGLAELERKVAANDERLVGPLKVTTADSLLAMVCDCLLAFSNLHPGVEIELDVTNSFADLARREADVAIRPTVNPPETLVGQRAASFDFALFEAHEARDSWIGFAAPMKAVPAVRWLSRNAPSDAVGIRTSGMWVAAQAAASGWGRVLLPEYLGHHFGLQRMGTPITELRSDLWVLFHPDLRRNPRVREFASFAADWLRRRFAG